MSWEALLEQWMLLEAAFHALFGVDLEEVLHVKTWRWFSVRTRYLLRTDNPLSRHFAPPTE